MYVGRSGWRPGSDAVVIGEGQLRARMRAFAPTIALEPRRPAGQIPARGDLGDLVVLTLAAVGRQRHTPGRLGDLEDRGANRRVFIASRAAQPVLPIGAPTLLQGSG
jgi:hypothetical protein